MIQRVIVHVGLHKTGTTSIQHFLRDNKEVLEAEYSVKLYKPFIHLTNGYVSNEVGISIMRDGVFDSLPHIVLDPEMHKTFDKDDWYKRIQERIADIFHDAEQDTLLLSGENISWLRTAGEAAKLRRLFPVENSKIQIILTLRDKKDWWVSYCNQINKLNLTGTPVHNSQWYLDEHSWLTDFETLIEVLESEFENVRIIPHQKNMVANFMRFIGFELDFSDEPEVNRSGQVFPWSIRVRHFLIRKFSGTKVHVLWRLLKSNAR